MSLSGTPERDTFSGKFGILAAAVGSAVGLGNIWRFPYVTGENGGGAFLLIYLFFILAIGFPVMLAELSIGRRAQRNAIGSFRKLAPGKPWYLVGLMGIVAAFLILAFYSTIAGWCLEFLAQAIGNNFVGKSADQLAANFDTFHTSTFRPLLWQMIFMFLTGFIIFFGVKDGIERYTKILMPILFVLIIIMAIWSLTLDGASEGLKFFFNPDFSKLKWSSVLVALGQAAFSLSIGMGTLITYGSYVKKETNLTSTAFQISISDTFFAILAGVMIFPAVFAYNIDPAAGPGLVFVVLPNIFAQMPGGFIFGILFFVLLSIAALTSTVSVLEVPVAYFVEELKMKRSRATILGAASIAFLGVFATLSFGVLSDKTLFGKSIFDWFDYLSANILLPLGAIFIVVFVGWYLGGKVFKDEISSEGRFRIKVGTLLVFVLKYLAPIAIAMVFIYGIFGGSF
jgi:neurotransmitter:Na+ symporter, NSS family